MEGLKVREQKQEKTKIQKNIRFNFSNSACGNRYPPYVLLYFCLYYPEESFRPSPVVKRPASAL